MKDIPRDPFNPAGEYYDYFSNPSFVMLRSPGPDGVRDLDFNYLREIIFYQFKNGPPKYSGVFDNDEMGLLHQIIDPYQYDPSNGTQSRGDLVTLMIWQRLDYGLGFACENPSPPNGRHYAFSLDPPHTAAGWNIDQPIPKPQNILEEQWYKIIVVQPFQLATELMKTGIYTKIPRAESNNREDLFHVVPERMDTLRNHLGPFLSFLEQYVTKLAFFFAGARCCERDEGWPLGAGLQERAPNHLKLRWLRVIVVNVKANGPA